MESGSTLQVYVRLALIIRQNSLKMSNFNLSGYLGKFS